MLLGDSSSVALGVRQFLATTGKQPRVSWCCKFTGALTKTVLKPVPIQSVGLRNCTSQGLLSGGVHVNQSGLEVVHWSGLDSVSGHPGGWK